MQRARGEKRAAVAHCQADLTLDSEIEERLKRARSEGVAEGRASAIQDLIRFGRPVGALAASAASRCAKSLGGILRSKTAKRVLIAALAGALVIQEEQCFEGKAVPSPPQISETRERSELPEDYLQKRKEPPIHAQSTPTSTSNHPKPTPP